jgi:hypothetical protein
MTSRENISKYILNSSLLNERLNYNFFNNIEVHVKDPLPEKFNLSYVFSKVENLIPKQFVYNVDSIVVGQFEDFLEKKVNASYKDGVLYITNNQNDADDMIDDIIHEIAHAVEELAYNEIYDDDSVKNEFLGKRERLYSICKKENINVNIDDFLNVNFSQDYDDLLYRTIGYPLLTNLSMGLFLSPYGITSIREYFATGFEHYYLKDRNYLKTISPKIYQKINYLETLLTRGDL